MIAADDAAFFIFDTNRVNAETRNRISFDFLSYIPDNR